MTNLKFLKTTTALVALFCAFFAESAWAEIRTGNACNDLCHYSYNTNTHELNIEKNANVPEGTEVTLSSVNSIIGHGGTLSNTSIGEGITGMGSYAFLNLATTAGSTLTLPSTFKHDSGGLFGTRFDNIDVSLLSNTSITLQAHNNSNGTYKPNIIMRSDSNITFVVGRGSGVNISGYDTRYEYNIICKGKQDDCQKQVKNGYWGGQILDDTSYYSGPDGNGNWEEWSDNGKAIYADSTKAKLLETYGFDGKQTASYNYNASGLLLSANTYDSEGNIVGSYNYTYDAGGNLVSAYQNGKAVYLRKRYTIPEADAATQGKGPFRLDITW